MAEVLIQPPSLSHTAKLVYAYHILDLFSKRQPRNHSNTIDSAVTFSEPQPHGHGMDSSTGLQSHGHSMDNGTEQQSADHSMVDADSTQPQSVRHSFVSSTESQSFDHSMGNINITEPQSPFSSDMGSTKDPQSLKHGMVDSTQPQYLHSLKHGTVDSTVPQSVHLSMDDSTTLESGMGDTDSTVLESEEVLDYLLRTHTESMLTEMILCLAPACLRNLTLKNCSHLSAEDVSRILKKCSSLSLLSVENCCTLDVGMVLKLAQPELTCLVTLNLSTCEQLKDEHVQTLIKVARGLQHLVLADTGVGDLAFLVDPLLQHPLEVAGQMSDVNAKEKFLCQLVAVNVSGCCHFSSDGLLHLCSLSGPSLRSVNIQDTKVDFQGLLFLSGHSRASANQFLCSLGCPTRSSASHSLSRGTGDSDQTGKTGSLAAQQTAAVTHPRSQECDGHDVVSRKRAGQIEGDKTEAGQVAHQIGDLAGGDTEDDRAASQTEADQAAHQLEVDQIEVHVAEDDQVFCQAEVGHQRTAQGVVMVDPLLAPGQHTDGTPISQNCCSVAEGPDVPLLFSSPPPPFTAQSDENQGKCVPKGSDTSQTRAEGCRNCDAKVENSKEGVGCEKCEVCGAGSYQPNPGYGFHATVAHNDENFNKMSTPNSGRTDCFNKTDFQNLADSFNTTNTQNAGDASSKRHARNEDAFSGTDSQKSSSAFSCGQTNAQDHANNNGPVLFKEKRREIEPRRVCGRALLSGSRMFRSNLTALAFTANISDIDISRRSERRHPLVCLAACLKANPNLRRLRLWAGCECGPQFADYLCRHQHHKVKEWRKQFYRQMLHTVGEQVPNLQHLGINQEEATINYLKDEWVSDLLNKCTHLQSLDLSGCYALTDEAFQPLRKNEKLRSLNLSPSAITLATPFFGDRNEPLQLSALDLSWCEEVEEAGLNQLLALCPRLTTLSLRCCPVTTHTLLVLAQSCTAIQQLDISGAAELEDDGIICLAKSLRNLTILDLSRNCGLGDECIKALLTHCPMLQTLDLSCLPHITSLPFLPIVSGSEWDKWRVQFQGHQSKKGSEKNSKRNTLLDGQVPAWDRMVVPHRSTTYGSCLQYVALDYCNNVEEVDMKVIVTACRGGLVVINYYKQRVLPQT